MFFQKGSASSESLHRCKICGEEVTDDFFSSDVGMCHACLVESKHFFEKYLTPGIDDAQKRANAATDADSRIIWLSSLLSYLYEYKIKYVDKGVQLIDQDVDELIDSVIDNISRVRVEDFPS